MKENYKMLVKVYSYKGNEFAIIKGLHDGIIRAIDYKYIDDNGQLTKQLNGLEMFVNTINNTINGVIERINNHFDWLDYVKENDIDITDDTELLKGIKAFYKL